MNCDLLSAGYMYVSTLMPSMPDLPRSGARTSQELPGQTQNDAQAIVDGYGSRRRQLTVVSESVRCEMAALPPNKTNNSIKTNNFTKKKRRSEMPQQRF